jgi:hypothetical protein
MDAFFLLSDSWFWWVSSIIAGICAQIIATVFIHYYRKIASARSIKAKAKSEALSKAIEKELLLLRTSENFRAHFRIKYMKYLVLSTFSFVNAIIIILIFQSIDKTQAFYPAIYFTVNYSSMILMLIGVSYYWLFSRKSNEILSAYQYIIDNENR